MFSQTAEYALRVVVYLGAQDGRPAKNREIAAATHVPGGYLAKVLQTLSREGLVRSRRGLYGGSVLTRDPREISVYDVLLIIDPPARIRRCPLGLAAHEHELCALHRRMDEAIALAEKALRETTIAAILRGEGGPPALVPGIFDRGAAESARREEEATIRAFPRRRS